MTDLLVNVSRAQFAATVVFHMIFPSITVGLSVFLAVMYAGYVWTGKGVFLAIYRFWLRIFAVAFAIGVVSGIVLTFELGLNWAGYADAVGPILGVIISMEVVTAFFLEAGFLGIMLYGEGRVSPRVHLFATCMVALGTLLSATWIISANSWMQTPAGYTRVGGQFQAVNWTAAILNPSFIYRFPHMLLAVLISTGFLIAGTSAYYLLKGIHLDVSRRAFSLALGAISVLLPLQLYMGDTLAFAMFNFQPPKMQAVEGNWGSTNTGYNVFVVPDQAGQRNLVQVAIPCLGSIIGRDLACHTAFPGLARTPVADQPKMVFPFWGFRLMFYLSILMFAVMASSIVLRLRRRLYGTRWFHRFAVWMTPAGTLAIIGGWTTAETGRQPWVAYGLLRTVDAVSPLSPPLVVVTAASFVSLYAGLFGIFIAYYLRTVRRGPVDFGDAVRIGDRVYEPAVTGASGGQATVPPGDAAPGPGKDAA
jgi:cytochrome bd ubiquinol oxidase subunit I